ncbi:MAG: hypothetical protein WAQ53_11005 [Thiofilum sp.]|uniref:hypothetical protein n=1 Tax=Thiofilum sp. TaxID=2212733 RepID=UPI0025F8CE07|nr:hypothetical protein [Thiofilum sp.]MBK8452720.1 hypothetical protein [Thiofilum sp.]
MKNFISIVSMVVITLVTTTSAYAATGTCHKARNTIQEKTWQAIEYKYTPKYIKDNYGEFKKVVDGGAEEFFKDCESTNLSDEQVVLQGALDFAALPLKVIADEFLVKVGLPRLGDKAFHIDIKDIEKHGIWGGPNSIFRKPFG